MAKTNALQWADADPRLADFRNFLWLIWKHLDLPDPTEIQYDFADFLQHGPKRCVIEAFRGVGKSYVTAAYVCWRLYLDPQLKIMVISASKDRADAFSSFVKRLIADVEILQHLKPRGGQRDSALLFDVGPARADQSPSVKSVGITGQLTGSRADLIVADDVETPKNSLTQTMRDRLATLVTEFDAILKPIKEARVIYLGTPQCEMSLYNVLPDRGYKIRVWPARFRKGILKMGDRLAPVIASKLELDPSLTEAYQGRGAPTDPQRFGDEDLIERETSYGKSGFALQFQLDTSLSDAEKYPLKLSDLMIMGLDPKRAPVALSWGSGPQQVVEGLPNMGLQGDQLNRPMWVSSDFAEYTGSVMWIDPSGRGKDETGYAVTKFLHGTVYLVDSGGFRDGYSEETLKALALIAKTHGVNYIGIESNFGDGMFLQLAKPAFARVHPCTMEEHRVSGQKEARIIDTLEPLLNQHRLVVDEGVVRKDYEEAQKSGDIGVSPHFSLIYQLTRVTRDRGALKHDDRLDALEGAVGYWLEQMAQDVDIAAQRHREDALQKDLDKFMEDAMGAPAGPPVWVSTSH